ncbi:MULTISPECIES: response regulator [Pedobacter]|jgi:CheY-like chemotaxis protein|uniref:Response regulator n=2 Tax=Pedobacter TaxID=84567 RepID=A0A7K0FQW1_9SPHI|nr:MULTISPECIES: response regulator [Pedobacter]MRX48021.1 response regulator [Pedobacter puniceum]QEK51956.1 response regulator [Pedobacter aquae]
MIDETLHILIIDDDEINNFIAAKLIDKIPPRARVSTCLNGQEGINYITSRLNNQKDLPDIIFLDINMPIMNGWEFLEEYAAVTHQISKKIVINMLSSSVYNDDISKSKTYPTVNRFISKPLTIEKIQDLYQSLGIS